MKKITLSILLIVFLSFSTVSYAADEKKLEDLFILVPIPVYAPETGWDGMLSGAYIFHPDPYDKITPASLFQLNAEYTQFHQSDLYLESDYYMKNNEYNFRFISEYSRYPDKFFGIGPAAVSAVPEDFTLEYLQIWLEAYKNVFMDLHVGARWIFQNSNMLETAAGGILASGSVPGSGGGRDSGIGILAKWDTRDNIYFSMSGDFHQLAAEFFGPAIGGDNSFIRYEADLRHYFRLTETQAIALQGYLYAETGSPPFYLMDTLGGNMLLRGYYDGSLRDRCAALVQSEYRWIFVPMFAVVVNAAAGTVANKLDYLSIGEVKFSAGLGLRFFFDQDDKVTFRVDWSIGSGTSGIYLLAGEAF